MVAKQGRPQSQPPAQGRYIVSLLSQAEDASLWGGKEGFSRAKWLIALARRVNTLYHCDQESVIDQASSEVDLLEQAEAKVRKMPVCKCNTGCTVVEWDNELHTYLCKVCGNRLPKRKFGEEI